MGGVASDEESVHGDDAAPALPDFPIAIDDDEYEDGAERQERKEPWGPYELASVWKGGVQIGWGGACACHSNTWQPDIACKKQLTFAANTSDDTRCLVKQWLLLGITIPRDAWNGQYRHVRSIKRVDIALRPEDELDAEAAAL